MTDPRGFQPGPYGSGYPPQQNKGPPMPAAPGWPQQQHQHQHQHHQHQQHQQQQQHHQQQHLQGYGPGPGFYPPRPGFQGGMPMPPQPQFNNGPPQPYPPSFNNNNINNTGFNSPRPTPAGRPLYGSPGGAGGGGGGGRPPFSPAQSYGPGTLPTQHGIPSPIVMSQVPLPPRHQEWPIAGRPPSIQPVYPPTSTGLGYPPTSAPLGQGQGPGQGSSPAHAPNPYTSPMQSSLPTFSGPTPYSSNLPSPVLNVNVPSAPAPKFSDTSSSFPNSLANPLAVPAPSSYRPKTSYQSAALASPKKDSKKPLAVPSPSPSWQSVSSATSTSSHIGYQSSHSQHRPPMQNAESFDADDRPTELIPYEEESVLIPVSHGLSAPNSKNNTLATLQSPAAASFSTSAAASPSLSFTTISYLPASPSHSDFDGRPTELPLQETVKSSEPLRKADPIPAIQPISKAPSTPLPTSGAKSLPASTFVPSTTYVPSKKEAPRFPTTPQPSSTGTFDPAVKVELSDLKPANTIGTSLNNGCSIKVALNDMPVRTLAKQQSDASLESPISLDGLLESIEAMGKSGSGLSLPSSYQTPVTQQATNVDHSKPLPMINEIVTEQKRYSLADGPVTPSNPSQSPSIARLIPKRPNSSFLPPPSGGISSQQNDTLPSFPTSSKNFSPPPQASQPSPFFPPPQIPRYEEAPQISFQHTPPSSAQHSHNHNHSHIGGDAMQLFSQPGFVKNPIISMAAFADRPAQKAPSMARRAKTLRRAAGMTGAANQQDPAQAPPAPPAKVTQDELYTYLLRLVLLAQEDEAPAPVPALALPVTNKDTHKDLVKALKARTKDIIAGKDPAYQDPVVIRALAVLEKQFKTTTNVEELMMRFSMEMSRVQQTMNIPTNNREAQLAIMANLIREAIQRDPFVGSEAILLRLDQQSKTTTPRPSNSAVQAEELIKVIRDLFRSQEATRHQRMNELRRNSTRKVAIEDLKKCISNLDLDSFPYPGIADYRHREHHEEFKTRERSALKGFIRVLSAGHPNLASIDMPKRQFHSSEFTFIPQNPKAYYHLLLEMCVDNALATRAEDDPASNLLSTSTKALLKDCGVRWRLTPSWREITLMEIIKERYREAKVSINFLLDFLHTKFYKDSDVNQWHISEVNMLGDVYGGLNHMIFDNINHDIKDLQSVSAAYFSPMLEILDRVHQREVYQRLNIDLTPFFEDIKETVILESIRSYNAKDEEIQKEQYENETVPLTKMALYIVSEHGIIKKRFPKPLFGTVDVAAIVVENNLRNFVPLMQNMANMDARKLPMADVFPLYQLCRELVTLFETYAPSSSAHFNISTWFRPYVLKYLEMLDASITEWVTAAIKQDQFEEVSVGAGHSSSASDLFTFFYEPLTWVKGLNWPDEYQRATFFSKLAKVFCKAVDLYAEYMETMFNGCMPSSVAVAASTEVKTLSEQLASFTFRSESAEAKKAAQFVFTPKMCVLVNNIEAVRQRLDELYRNMDVDEAAQILRDYDPVVEPDPEAPRQFEIMFVCAERLLPLDSNEASDPFIVMWHDGKEVFRSKTIGANINPRWNEVYEATLTKDVTYLIRIYDYDKVHKDRLCGWQYLCIDPQDYEDYMAHDVWLDLTQIGRLLLRITMKGEREDIQFFFGRTFRSLKRKETEMSAMIVDAMVPSVRACLTEKVLFNNFRSKAMFSFFGTSVSSTKVTQVSDEDCDNALGQLIDYMEASLPVLYDYLTAEGMVMVITKLWREMLITIESLLMPPLSNTVSDRTPLTEIEMHVVFKVVEFIKLYLNGGDAGDGFPLKVLEIPKYKDLLTVRPIYDSSAEELITEYNHALTVPGRGRLGRQQSDYDRRFAGAVKRASADSLTPNPETVLRILRMRREDNVEEFLQNAIETQSKAREARAKAKRDQISYQRQMMRENNI
ncbi:hypothetical protein BGX27_005855 [Mortierella sp. AM989]|nr:hypothetical protein BGX27_005855 [Mortierella sp. AM989]